MKTKIILSIFSPSLAHIASIYKFKGLSFISNDKETTGVLFVTRRFFQIFINILRVSKIIHYIFLVDMTMTLPFINLENLLMWPGDPRIKIQSPPQNLYLVVNVSSSLSKFLHFLSQLKDIGEAAGLYGLLFYP